MESLPGRLDEPLCPRCGTQLMETESADRCWFCRGDLPRKKSSPRRNPLARGLVASAHGYRAWSLGVFALALLDLLRIGDARAFWVGFMVLFPFGTALAIAWVFGESTPRWIVAFLLLVDLGVIFAPAHQILPGLNLFPELRQTQSRILTWYFLVYGTLHFGVAPPIVFARSLRTSWSGAVPIIAPWICVFGFLVWGLLMCRVTLGLISVCGR